MDAKPKTLTEACAPAFLYLTAFRRNSATSTQSIDGLRQALTREIEAVRAACEQDPRLRPLFERTFYALVTTADQVVLSSDWAQRAGWSMQLLEMHYFKTAQGGKKFYALVDEVLGDPTPAAAELAELLFTCMALGFQGELLGEPRELERRRRQLFEKARLAGKLGDTLVPDAYGRNAAKDLTRLPTAGTLRFVLLTVAALVFYLVVANVIVPMKAEVYTEPIGEVLETLQERP